MIQKKTPDSTTAESSAPNTAQFTGPKEEFNTQRSAFAQRRHNLRSVAAPNGTTTYWAERWGLVRYLPSLHDAALFLAQIGGRL